jgi:hypothetical protein
MAEHKKLSEAIEDYERAVTDPVAAPRPHGDATRLGGGDRVGCPMT